MAIEDVKRKWWIREKADDLWQRMMQRLTAILLASYALIFVMMVMYGFHVSSAMKHDRCIESLRSQTVNPAIIMTLCRD